MPDPTGLVPWEDLRVGETYWVIGSKIHAPEKMVVEDRTENSVTPCGECIGEVGDVVSFYATCAQACRAMIQRLEAFMAEQGDGVSYSRIPKSCPS